MQTFFVLNTFSIIISTLLISTDYKMPPSSYSSSVSSSPADTLCAWFWRLFCCLSIDYEEEGSYFNRNKCPLFSQRETGLWVNGDRVFLHPQYYPSRRSRYFSDLSDLTEHSEAGESLVNSLNLEISCEYDATSANKKST